MTTLPPITSEDMFAIWRRGKKLIGKVALACALLALLYGLSRPVTYKVEATFRDKGKAQTSGDSKNPLMNLLEGQTGSQSEAKTLFSSRRLAREVIRSEGLQARIVPKNFYQRYLARIPAHLATEWALLTKSRYPAVADRNIPLAKDVDYTAETPTALDIQFTSSIDYLVNGTLQGRLNEPFHGQGYAFTLYNRTGGPFAAERYLLTLEAMESTQRVFEKNNDADADKKDKTLVKLTFFDTDRHRAAGILNSLMHAYQEWQQEEQEKIAARQIAYLRQRDKEETANLQEMMRCCAESQENDVCDCGFATTEIAMESLSASQQAYKQQQRSIDLEIKRLNNFREHHYALYDRYENHGDAAVINEWLAQRRSLQRQADALSLAVAHAPLQPVPQGMNLQLAHELYLNYSRDINMIDAEFAQGSFIINNLHNPEFELTSLSTVANDPVSKEIIAQYSKLLLTFKDQDNRSTREQDRLRNELLLQRGFLEMHLAQTNSLLQLRRHLLQEKIHELQAASLFLVRQEVQLIDKQLQAFVESRLKNLEHERDALAQQQNQLKKEMGRLPQKWIQEKLVQQKLELTKNMSHELTKLVETKNIANHMEIVRSAPIDLAYPPLQPASPHLFLFAILGGGLGAMGSAFFLLARESVSGIRAAKGNLLLAGQNAVDASSNADETARSLITYIRPTDRTVLLLPGKGEDYSTSLASLMHRSKKRVLIIPLTFDTSDHPLGLCRYLENGGTTPHIHHHPCYDYLVAGGSTPYAAELSQSALFRKLLDGYLACYDLIVLTSRASPLSPMAKALFQSYDRTIISLTDEKVHELEPLFRYHKENEKIIFLVEAGIDQ